MARIRPLERREVDVASRAVFDRFEQQRGNVPNMFRTMARRPELMATAEAHMRAIFGTGTVPERLKEMLAVRVSQINECDYCCASHMALAEKQGVSRELLEAMYHIDAHASAFTAAERAALTLAERMTTDSHGVDEDVWAEVQAHFDDGQIVELAAVIGLFNYFNRFSDALGIDVTPLPREQRDAHAAGR
jgi:uncharacterized peroxidase-related enzyme